MVTHLLLHAAQHEMATKYMYRYAPHALTLTLAHSHSLTHSLTRSFVFRYYKHHGLMSAQGGDRFVVATACLYIAAKVGEAPKKLVKVRRT